MEEPPEEEPTEEPPDSSLPPGHHERVYQYDQNGEPAPESGCDWRHLRAPLAADRERRSRFCTGESSRASSTASPSSLPKNLALDDVDYILDAIHNLITKNILCHFFGEPVSLSASVVNLCCVVNLFCPVNFSCVINLWRIWGRIQTARWALAVESDSPPYTSLLRGLRSVYSWPDLLFIALVEKMLDNEENSTAGYASGYVSKRSADLVVLIAV
ncbi:uncharacterized protein PODANS_1_22505 [Podospora anserina S mat+]|uniref:Podospora anserina S mat+ genomic DNA chromosome 1, supercontig 6 n=1 Tax=Podospora anserina (strain S / ATCC MYA-4624 / DSM 980 / FGSC 10383) TaxID=515849 RepID=B2AS66_PODAN|nr:uncharacterized protein PODANS_1_22505 [Podospora anserina S mat+]CAP67239.1 unnamed protein product [Podospora anserina S mat+]CDP24650.1 Putative protein of unknown function [Podospora anserina S mat+]